jgi:prophage antirepressor-like protein
MPTNNGNSPAASGEIVSFAFEGSNVRAFDYQGEPCFIGNEVAAALGYSDPNYAVRTHCKALKLLKAGETPGLGIEVPPRGMNIIPERDVYRLVMRSKLPSAESFEEKVVAEILPAIRKTGGYLVTREDDTPEIIMARALKVADAEIKRREATITQMKPGYDTHQAVMDAGAAVRLSQLSRSFRTVNMNAFANPLRDMGYLHRDSRFTKTWRVTRTKRNDKLFFEKLSMRETNGNARLESKIYVTPAGKSAVTHDGRSGIGRR